MMRYELNKKILVFLVVAEAIIVLSFVNTPVTPFDNIPHIDKFVHFCMYFTLSAVLWNFFFDDYGIGRKRQRNAWFCAFLCPVLIGGIIEFLQNFLAVNHNGNWRDFIANFLGVLLASILFCLIINGRKKKK